MCHSCNAIHCVRRLPCRAILEGVDKFGNLFVQVGPVAIAPINLHSSRGQHCCQSCSSFCSRQLSVSAVCRRSVIEHCSMRVTDIAMRFAASYYCLTCWLYLLHTSCRGLSLLSAMSWVAHRPCMVLRVILVATGHLLAASCCKV